MEALQQHLQQLVEGKIDFEGQKKVDQITKVSLVGATIISFLLGFALQSLWLTLVTFGLSNVLLLLVVVPQWPIYNHHPVQWLPVKEKKGSEVKSQ